MRGTLERLGGMLKFCRNLRACVQIRDSTILETPGPRYRPEVMPSTMRVRQVDPVAPPNPRGRNGRAWAFGALRVFALTILSLVTLSACESSAKLSAEKAKGHVAFLKKAAETDVTEVRQGLPKGAEHLRGFFESTEQPQAAAQKAREALEKARGKVQDLRVAKSTFFALAMPTGHIIRNDQEHDAMAGKNLFKAFPELKAAEQKYIETRGSMPEASGVRGKPDGQWVAAAPVKLQGKTVGLYVTGWSWARYAYRLETGLRSQVKSDTKQGDSVPLLYVYLVVGKNVFGAPVSPDVNAEAIAKLKPLEQAKGNELFQAELDITGRGFGVAVQRVPALGKDVAIAVLRSET